MYIELSNNDLEKVYPYLLHSLPGTGRPNYYVSFYIEELLRKGDINDEPNRVSINTTCDEPTPIRIKPKRTRVQRAYEAQTRF